MHAGSNDPRTFLALLTRCIPGLFIMIARGFVDYGIFCGAFGAGEPDNIPASGSGNLRFYGVFYHCFTVFFVFCEGEIFPDLGFDACG